MNVNVSEMFLVLVPMVRLSFVIGFMDGAQSTANTARNECLLGLFGCVSAVFRAHCAREQCAMLI